MDKKILLSLFNRSYRTIRDYMGSLSLYKFYNFKKKTKSCDQADLPDVIRLYQQNFDGGHEASIERYQRLFKHTFYIIKNEEGEMMGYCLYTIHFSIQNQNIIRYATIYSFAVDDRFQGEGIGGTLLSESITELKNNNIYVIRLFVDMLNSPAVHLYKKFNFNIQGTIENRCGQGKKCYSMELLL
ncbi:ribosomal-protein-alanine N-acetyltransferase [Methanocalculus alkaliphilus]|uniref:GNAT family N-acetyltransferase n=1 Tax=Methanocalculus alkaliphilus TaxID=768730 RepID=UPI00209CE703|nr:N-acetyltransferase [Methanocalculus alkaliphilus]MCP1714652.1 ribosomal-protein-alanine N-acetyltransferase [Methanocalculus alkaliphilus]